MIKVTVNPFQFSGPVEGDYYFPRPELSSVTRQFVEHRVHVALIGPRRSGKTSFLLDLLRNLENEGYSCLLVDMFNITSHQDFLDQMLRTLRDKANFKDKLKSWWKRVRQLSPQLNLRIDPVSGNPALGFSLSQLTDEDVKEGIQNLLEELSDLDGKVIVAVDEFQRVSELDDNGWLEAVLRAHFQKLANVCFIFTESRKDLVADTMKSSLRPLYDSCQVIEFTSPGPAFAQWVIDRFETVGITCEKEAIDHLCSLVHNAPNYVQMVCFHLVAPSSKVVTIQDVEKALKTVVRLSGHTYQELLDSLPVAQQRVLRLATTERKTLFQKGRDLLRNLTA